MENDWVAEWQRGSWRRRKRAHRTYGTQSPGAQDTQQLRVVDCCILLTAPKFKGSAPGELILKPSFFSTTKKIMISVG